MAVPVSDEIKATKKGLIYSQAASATGRVYYKKSVFYTSRGGLNLERSQKLK